MFTCASFVYTIFCAPRGVFRIFLAKIENNGTQPRCTKQLKQYSANKKFNRSVLTCKICTGSKIDNMFAVPHNHQTIKPANHLRANTPFQFFNCSIFQFSNFFNSFMHLDFVPLQFFGKIHVFCFCSGMVLYVICVPSYTSVVKSFNII